MASVLVLGLTAGLLAVGPPAMSGADLDVTGGNEPTAAVVNPQNPANVAIANFGRLFLSTDYGQNFAPSIQSPIPASYAAVCNIGRNADDVLAFDAAGNLYWTYILFGDTDCDTNRDDQTIVVSRIDPADGSVDQSVDITPGAIGDDKSWIAADANPTSPYANNVYVVWTRLTGQDRVMFSRSTDGGATFSAPTQISDVQAANELLPPPAEGFVWGTHTAVAQNGDLYVSYHTHNTCGGVGGGIIPVIRDGTGGAALQAGTVPQKTTAFGVNQAEVTCNVQDGSGDEIPQTQFWMLGSQAGYILPDPARAGNVYVVSNDDPNNDAGSGDDGDVVFARSTDHAQSWSVSKISNEPGDTLQVFPSAAIDQDGNIAVHWYDNRLGATNGGTGANGNDNWLLDRFGTASLDGGLTFSNDFRINEQPFDPDLNASCVSGPQPPCRDPGDPVQQTFRIGEYHGITATDGIAYGVWTGNQQPVTSTSAQRIFYDLFSIPAAFADRLEPNESTDFAVVASLGADETYNADRLSLHTATDVDFFKVLALHTGWLETEIAYNELVADLEVRALDQFGNVVETGTDTLLQTGSTEETLAIPVVEGRTYFLEVRDPGAPQTFAPQSLYDLSIVNRSAPVPFHLDLVPGSDTGRDDADDLTFDDTPAIRVRVDDAAMLAAGIDLSTENGGTFTDDPPGFKVQLFENGNAAGLAAPVGGQPGVYDGSLTSLADGLHSVTARVLIVDPSDPPAAGVTHFVGQGDESDGLLVRVDTAAPAAPSTPDLLASADTGGIDIDDITTIIQPAFKGTGEARSLLRVLADGDEVGLGTTGIDGSDGLPGDGNGAFEITLDPLDDAVYDITATAEDLAGNVSVPSGALPVTIANQTLNLSGATADVAVDLQNSTVTGYPGIPGGVIGILNIPTVNLGANGNALTVDGRSGDDSITWQPTASDGGTLTRQGSSQALNFAGVAGAATLDPLAGTDEVTVVGTSDPDTFLGMVHTLTTVQVNALKTIGMPATSTEHLSLLSRLSADTIDLTVFDSVNGSLSVDAGVPDTNPQDGDQLIVRAGSAKAKLQKQPGGGSGGGSVFVSYPQTTGNQSRVDYASVESVKLIK